MRGLHTPLVVAGGAAAIALGAQVSVPMVPVSTTLQTLAVVLLGLVAGSWRGATAAALYLALVLADLPVLSSGQRAGGLAFLEFPPAGYVVAFVPGAFVAGWLGHRGGLLRRVGAGVASHALVLAIGGAVLATWIGPADAFTKGVAPFLVGAVAKSAVAAAGASIVRRGVGPDHHDEATAASPGR